ncbi:MULTISPECIES: spore germination protein GerPE [Clostridia]|uniref:spore germination protein GerPE n=1 Tax=Clostridia TaxID=186801 RepID=UPI001314FD32|nr:MULTISPECIES: spore germination protein GerPE [Clostridia]
MDKRTAVVDNLFTNSVSNSSVLSIGDTNYATLKFKGIAVQKQVPTFSQEDEETFDYPLFKRDTNWPAPTMGVRKITTYHNRNICVANVATIGVSASSLLQIGSLTKGYAEARVKHFRKLKGAYETS